MTSQKVELYSSSELDTDSNEVHQLKLGKGRSKSSTGLISKY